MLPITKMECGGLLSVWLEKQGSAAVVKEMAKKAGYRDNPFFGAKKRKLKIIGETLIVNCAIIIQAVNHVLPPKDAKPVIDYFLLACKTPIFAWIEEKDPTFNKKYPSHIETYYKVLRGNQPGIGLSFLYMKNLDLDPSSGLENQLLLAGHFTALLASTIEMLENLAFLD